MFGAVIGQQVPLGGDARQRGAVAMRHVADDKKGRLDVQFLQRIQHFFGMGIGAIVKGERDGVGAGQAGMENAALLEQRQLRLRGCADRRRPRQ